MKEHQKSYLKTIQCMGCLTAASVVLLICISSRLYLNGPIVRLFSIISILGFACCCAVIGIGGAICLYRDLHPEECLPALTLLPSGITRIHRWLFKRRVLKKVVVGEIVEVRSVSEILSTLDSNGALEAMPFMPEMLKYCGRRFKVYKRADKTCDTITGAYLGRRMKKCVHLADLRCDGEYHGECDATCLFYWKEAWIKRVPDNVVMDREHLYKKPESAPDPLSFLIRVSELNTSKEMSKRRYRCQITELIRASFPLHWLDPWQYIRDIFSGNLALKAFLLHFTVLAFNTFQRLHKGFRYPYFNPKLMDRRRTPNANLHLKPGELVEVRSKEEILQTLNSEGKNRGLYYDMPGELVKYCGQRTTVLKKVKKIIDERDGTLVTLPNNSVILNGFICTGEFTPKRFFCPRASYPFWREIWLKRASDKETISPK